MITNKKTIIKKEKRSQGESQEVNLLIPQRKLSQNLL